MSNVLLKQLQKPREKNPLYWKVFKSNWYAFQAAPLGLVPSKKYIITLVTFSRMTILTWIDRIRQDSIWMGLLGFAKACMV
jgi:hypothetical protein